MKSVFIVVSILNGYKNIESVFENRQDAIDCMDLMTDDWHYEFHELAVCEYELFQGRIFFPIFFVIDFFHVVKN